MLVALKRLVLLLGSLIACIARIVVDRHTHRQTTVTLAAHARRGIITNIKLVHESFMKGKNNINFRNLHSTLGLRSIVVVQILGELHVRYR